MLLADNISKTDATMRIQAANGVRLIKRSQSVGQWSGNEVPQYSQLAGLTASGQLSCQITVKDIIVSLVK